MNIRYQKKFKKSEWDKKSFIPISQYRSRLKISNYEILKCCRANTPKSKGNK